ncbi:MAG: hypothetical protein P1V97_01625, partial [Planctomycetota bacterium]|nr:hypothetical protein [Planctomycetota bacterium]
MNRIRQLLEPQHRPFGLIINKTHVRLVQLHSSSLLSHIQWPLSILLSHPNSLDAFAWLLSLANDDQATLKEIFKRAQSLQSPLTDILRVQVKSTFQALFQCFVQDFDHSPVLNFQQKGETTSNQSLQEMLLVVLMRFIVLLYAEQKNLLPINDPIYQSSYSLQNIIHSLENPPNSNFPDYSSDAWQQFLANSRLLYHGCHHPALNLIPYGSQLFNPKRFPILEQWKLRNRDLHKILGLLTQTPNKQSLSFESLDVEQMGFLYEGLLEIEITGPPTQRTLIPSPLRKDSGTYYTPRSLTVPLVEHTLSPLIHNENGTLKTPREILNLKVCDLTAGSGAFLVQMTRYLATALHESWLQQAAILSNAAIPTLPFAEAMLDPRLETPLPINDPKELEVTAQRLIVERCIYGVDLNPLAIQIAQLSLWILSLSKHRPFTFLNHSLKTGNSLLGIKLPQLQSWNLKTPKNPLPILTQIAKEKVALALAKRQQLARLSVLSPEDRAFKEQALKQADSATKNLKLAADLLLGTTLHKPKQLTDAFSQFLNAESTDSWKALEERAQNNLRSQQSFHWPLEFPEIFNSKRNGFDAILANPPFQGGQKLSASLGPEVRNFLVEQIASGTRGSADLSAYFLRRAFSLLRPNGKLGIIVTNSVTQGNSRKVALEPLLKNGATIYRAETSAPWPGAASLNITTLHISKGTWNRKRYLNGKECARISPSLDCIEIPVPKTLTTQKNKAFQGTIPVGNGFIISPKQATAWLLSDPNDAKVLFPYLTGKDFNNSPTLTPTRWIINFHDWPIEKAKLFQKPFKHIQETVKPFRMEAKLKSQRANWWLHGASRKTLYQTIRRQDLILARSRISNRHILSFVPAKWIYSDGIVVFATQQYAEFAILQSNIHELWARRFSSTLRADMRYSLTTAFETFPMPTPSAEQKDELSKLAKDLENQRWKIISNKAYGLNKIYACLHDPANDDPSIIALRECHRKIDEAVLKAYEWSDLIASDMLQFNNFGKRFQLSFSKSLNLEITQRLSDLNAKKD